MKFRSRRPAQNAGLMRYLASGRLGRLAIPPSGIHRQAAAPPLLFRRDA